MSHPMQPVVFDQRTGRDRGRAQGELWRTEIAELIAIRTQLAVERGVHRTSTEVHKVAAAHLPMLAAFDGELSEELLGIAEGANATAAQIIILNHYTDLRDVPCDAVSGADDAAPAAGDGDGCTAIYIGGQDDPVLAQTWDMHATAEPFVRMLRIKPRDGSRETLCFTLTGCLALAGMGQNGVSVTINNLTMSDGRIGVVWPALVRAMLDQPRASAAYEVLCRTPLSSGHHYMIADGHEFYGVECSAELKVLTQEGARAAHLHTNHCFDPVLRKRERVSRGSNTFERLNLASTVFAQQRPANLDELWKLMASHDGAPHSLCSHLDDHYGDPNASRTCGMIAMRPSAGNLRVVRGCAFTQPAIDLSLERYAGRK